jgi:uncharacterized protein (TIGR01777 family)
LRQESRVYEKRRTAMKIFMTGGTGFIGTTLTRELTGKGHEITILARGTENRKLPQGASYLEGNPTVRGPWQERVPGFDALINLAGSPIFTRWNDDIKRDILESRILTTRNLVEAMQPRKGQDISLFSTSAVGYYGFHGDEELEENSPAGNDFLATVAVKWENEAQRAKEFGARVVICRFGIVIGRNGGIMGQLVPVFRRRMGAVLGSGSQWLSWIHELDLANVFAFLLDKKEIAGPLNCTAPEPVRNAEMTRILGEALDVPILLPAVPGFVLKLIQGEFGNVVLEGQRVLPRRLLDAGFKFRFPTFREAVKDVLK